MTAVHERNQWRRSTLFKGLLLGSGHEQRVYPVNTSTLARTRSVKNSIVDGTKEGSRGAEGEMEWGINLGVVRPV